MERPHSILQAIRRLIDLSHSRKAQQQITHTSIFQRIGELVILMVVLTGRVSLVGAVATLQPHRLEFLFGLRGRLLRLGLPTKLKTAPCPVTRAVAVHRAAYLIDL